ncbi:hypothetical protein BDQ17DRAFT_1330884 [Cyathus striatus]|nr:hypothetical protein BDQ17DRAFT_1330884 [Cyathus striatus]
MPIHEAWNARTFVTTETEQWSPVRAPPPSKWDGYNVPQIPTPTQDVPVEAASEVAESAQRLTEQRDLLSELKLLRDPLEDKDLMMRMARGWAGGRIGGGITPSGPEVESDLEVGGPDNIRGTTNTVGDVFSPYQGGAVAGAPAEGASNPSNTAPPNNPDQVDQAVADAPAEGASNPSNTPPPHNPDQLDNSTEQTKGMWEEFFQSKRAPDSLDKVRKWRSSLSAEDTAAKTMPADQQLALSPPRDFAADDQVIEEGVKTADIDGIEEMLVRALTEYRKKVEALTQDIDSIKRRRNIT